MVPIMDITPPMPAIRALAAPADIGPPKRISKKVRAAIDAMVSGEFKRICDAAAKVGLARESLSRALSTPHVTEHLRQKVLRHLAIHAARAGCTKTELLDSPRSSSATAPALSSWASPASHPPAHLAFRSISKSAPQERHGARRRGQGHGSHLRPGRRETATGSRNPPRFANRHRQWQQPAPYNRARAIACAGQHPTADHQPSTRSTRITGQRSQPSGFRRNGAAPVCRHASRGSESSQRVTMSSSGSRRIPALAQYLFASSGLLISTAPSSNGWDAMNQRLHVRLYR